MGPRVWDALYLFAFVTAGPIYWIWRALVLRRPLAPVRARLRGPEPLSTPHRSLWIHGVSVGEILAARRLVEELEKANPLHEIVLSVGTRAGFDMARARYPECRVIFAPFDFTWTLRRFFRALRPRALILLELELWPNWLRMAAAAEVPVVVASAKMSATSVARYRKLAAWAPGMLEAVAAFGAQSEVHAARLRELGVGSERVVVTGNLKVDNLPVAPSRAAAEGLREELALGDSPVFLAGSTHPKEEEIVLRAWKGLRERFPHLRLILAPRHVDRAEEIRTLVEKEGVTARLRSREGPEDASETVLVVDTMGELMDFFAVADVVFLGGSLVPVGGHNLLEPASQGRPVLFGPHVESMADVAQELIDEKAGWSVTGSVDIIRTASDLFSDPGLRAHAETAAREVVNRRRGATRKTMELLQDILPEPQGATHV
ncbi:MAG TPA: 3-deoxy-D-manno-octulosonic acid transferase [Planctomycetes bacterium]|nr:3-deoxy-D-manno-octulosonic acid transferase [Planctomycetota bacterium]